jgi:exopolyphosphatase/guanosine-5'-triphosphate,3'-diphosphate pyrophosphatase
VELVPPSLPNVAAIDIGSNSVRLLVADPAGRELVRLMQITRLGQGVDQTGTLAIQAIQRTALVIDEYAGHVRQHGVGRLRVTATSAARDASNREALFARIRDALGVEPELLSGQEEATLSFQGATAGRSADGAPFVVMDIGGGSTEFAFGSTAPERSISLALGCVRITERFLKSDPPSAAELSAAARYTRELLERVEPEVGVGRAKTWLGLAGTVTSLAARDAGLERYDPNVTHGYQLTREAVERIHTELARASAAERGKLLIQPRRASVIVGGSVALLEVMRVFDIQSLVVSERDILDGLAASLLGPGGAQHDVPLA